MIQQIPEFDCMEMYKDYVSEMKNAGEEPLSYYEWLNEEQIEQI